MDDVPGGLLKTQQVARALGVGVSTVKRWVNAGILPAAKTVGGHRLIDARDVVRFARDRGLPAAGLAGPVALGIGVAAQGVDAARVEALALALKRGRVREAKALIDAAHSADADAVALGDGLIRPVMEAIGDEWEAGGLDVYQEHRATRAVESALIESLRRHAGEPSAGAPLALGASPEGDHYTLSGLLCELALRERGWDVMNLGANLPLASLAKAVRVHHPRLVWISAHRLPDADRFLRDYRLVLASAAPAGAAVILGGPAFGPALRARLDAAHFGDCLADLAHFARRVAPPTTPPEIAN